jgi:hypothetical protein
MADSRGLEQPRAISRQSSPFDNAMKFIHLFLIGYFILIVGIGLALWQTGVLSRLAPIWIVISAIVAVGVGIMMAVSSGKPDITEESGK